MQAELFERAPLVTWASMSAARGSDSAALRRRRRPVSAEVPAGRPMDFVYNINQVRPRALLTAPRLVEHVERRALIRPGPGALGHDIKDGSAADHAAAERSGASRSHIASAQLQQYREGLDHEMVFLRARKLQVSASELSGKHPGTRLGSPLASKFVSSLVLEEVVSR